VVDIDLFRSYPPNIDLGNGSNSDFSQQSRPQNKRMQQAQAQVNEVIGIMKVNVEKVLERDAKLTHLDDRAGKLNSTRALCSKILLSFLKDIFMHTCLTLPVWKYKSSNIHYMQMVISTFNLSYTNRAGDRISQKSYHALQEGASQFERSAASLKRKYWWKNCKMIILIGGVVFILIVIIIAEGVTLSLPP
uniref:V-SNARE coiled-coil homology domain-containing protein n=1 Tax=Romanomermis culicivorax TaxID=13658 RepID=A0A915JWT3_ROMCU